MCLIHEEPNWNLQHRQAGDRKCDTVILSHCCGRKVKNCCVIYSQVSSELETCLTPKASKNSELPGLHKLEKLGASTHKLPQIFLENDLILVFINHYVS